MEKGLVSGHAMEIYLENVSFIVSETGRQRCLTEGRKNVHAFVKGVIVKASASVSDFRPNDFVLITYNPYKSAGFYIKDSEGNLTVMSARSAIITTNGIYAWGVE